MPNRLLNRSLNYATAGIMLFSLIAAPVSAEGGDNGQTPIRPEVSSSPKPSESPEREASEVEASKSPRPSRSPEVEGKEIGKLDAARLHVCEVHHDVAVNIMKRITDRADKQETTFNAIATRAETFYTAKGHTLSNYDTLVAAVATAKAKVDADLVTLKADAAINCSGSDPKGQLATFKTQAQQLVTDLKAYRTAIKTLIAGIRSVNPAPSPSVKPSPSASPEGSN